MAGMGIRGRPRSEASHHAVLDAAAKLLEQERCSYQDLTVERIAAEAGVGKQTIYRWWKNKAGVVLEALLTGRLKLDFEPVPNTGDLRADLMSWLDSEITRAGGEDTAVMARSLMAALVTGGEETRALLNGGIVWEGMAVAERLRAEQEAGGLREGVDPSMVAATIMDPFIIRLITVGSPDPEWMRAQLDMVLTGILPRD